MPIMMSNEALLSLIDLGEVSASETELLLFRARLTEVMKYSIISICLLPMLLVYPIVQKHFVKGVMVGALKG